MIAIDEHVLRCLLNVVIDSSRSGAYSDTCRCCGGCAQHIGAGMFPVFHRHDCPYVIAKRALGEDFAIYVMTDDKESHGVSDLSDHEARRPSGHRPYR